MNNQKNDDLKEFHIEEEDEDLPSESTTKVDNTPNFNNSKTKKHNSKHNNVAQPTIIKQD